MEGFAKYQKSENRDITNETSASLAARINLFKGVSTPDWVKAYLTEAVAAAPFTFSECWSELYKRENDKKMSPVRNALEQAAKNNMIRVVDPVTVQVVNRENKVMKMDTVMGFIVRSVPDEKIKTQINTIAVVEALKDVVSAAVTSSNEGKKTVNVVIAEDAQKVRCPVYPVSNKFYNADEKRVATRKEMMRDIDAVIYENPMGIIDYLSKVNGMKWENSRFVVDINIPKIRSWSAAFQYLLDSRRYRGKDSSEQAQASVGYYYGSMTDLMYRTAYVVSDLTRLSNMYGIKRLEISSMNNIITLTVIHSLVSSGWVIRNIHDYTRPVATDASPGYYQNVKFESVYLRYIDCQDKFPLTNGAYTPTPAYVNFMSRVKIEGVVDFTYLYAQSALFSESTIFLIPTAHAHAGDILCVGSKPVDYEPIKEENYRERMVQANACKNMFPYTRQRFIEKDPFVSKYPFSFVLAKVFSTVDDSSYTFEVFKQDTQAELKLAATLESFKKELEEDYARRMGMNSKEPPKQEEVRTNLLDAIKKREVESEESARMLKDKVNEMVKPPVDSKDDGKIDIDALNTMAYDFE